MKAVKRVKGNAPAFKLSMTLSQIQDMKAHLDLHNIADVRMWCVINMCFYGLLRISSVTVPCASDWDITRILTRGDIQITSHGCILTFRWSKTIQFRERTFQAVLPHLPNSSACPTTALINFLQLSGPLPDSAPGLAFRGVNGQVNVLTPAAARQRLQQVFLAMGLNSKDYSSHSLRRSGATHLLSAGVPIEVIKILGDWKSDCVFKYLKPNPSSKLEMVNKLFC